MTKKFSDEEKRTIIKEALEIGNRTEVGRRYGVNESTIRSWMKSKKFHSTNSSGKSFRKIEKENETLKKLLGEKDLEISILKDCLGKK